MHWSFIAIQIQTKQLDEKAFLKKPSGRGTTSSLTNQLLPNYQIILLGEQLNILDIDVLSTISQPYSYEIYNGHF